MSNNRYGLTVNEGDVLLDKPDGVDAVSLFALIMNNASSTVKLLASNQIHNSTDVNGTHQINAGTLDLNGFDEGIARINTLDTDGVVTNSDGGTTSTLTLQGGSIDATFAGAVTGNLNLVKEGTNTQTLTGANTHTGTTTINNGTLQIGAGGTTGSLSGAVVNNSVLAFNRSNTYGVNNDISGTGSVELTAQAGADSSINGTNTYSGGTTINGGRFRVATDGNLGDTSGALTLNGGGLKNNNGALTLDAARNVVIDDTNGGRMQAGWNSDITINGVISGAGDLIIEGDSGTVVLANAANTFSGEINLQDSNSALSAESLGAAPQ